MKKLILIACLNFIGMVFSSEEFPHIKSHFPIESLLREQCEEYGRIKSPDHEQLQGISVCKNIDMMFPLIAQQIYDSHKKPSEIIGLFFRIDQPALQMAVREEMRQRLSKKKYAQEEAVAIEAILGHQKLSEIDKRKEYRLLRDYYVMAAEEGLRDRS